MHARDEEEQGSRIKDARKILVALFSGVFKELTEHLHSFPGILCADYYLVKHSRIDVPELYKPQGIYRYTWGVNWRALVALVSAIGPAIPGIGASLSPSLDIGGAKYIFMIGDVWGMVVGGLVHVGLSKAFPDVRSLSPANVYAQDVIDGERLETRSETEEGEEEKKDDGVLTSVVSVA